VEKLFDAVSALPLLPVNEHNFHDESFQARIFSEKFLMLKP
jgi:hypothetical protein